MLKVNTSAKADIWKRFPLVWAVTKGGSDGSDEHSVQHTEMKYFCACKKCLKVYQYKDPNGLNHGTKTLIEHDKRCFGSMNMSDKQALLHHCVVRKPQFSKQDEGLMKRREVAYCVEGYHSFRAVEHDGFVKLMQTCVDFGAKYGKFDVSSLLLNRQPLSREVAKVQLEVKAKLAACLREASEDGTVSLTIDMYTDDYRKKSYLDIHASWIDREFSCHHAALAVRHFGTAAHTGDNISRAVSGILAEYGLPENDRPATTDHGSNIVAALKNSVRLDCLCHRLHTVLETAWRDTKRDEPQAAAYETAISELCRFAKQSTGIQEQLPRSLKHGGDTRPWVSMYRRAESVDCSYEVLVTVLTAKNRLELVAAVNRSFNREVMEVTRGVKDVFECLEKSGEPTLQIVGPSYYLLVKKFSPALRESNAMKTFKQNLRKYLDEKFYTSINALHWMATFIDPTFKQLEFIPQNTTDEQQFKRDLLTDLDAWMLAEMELIAEKLNARTETGRSDNNSADNTSADRLVDSYCPLASC